MRRITLALVGAALLVGPGRLFAIDVSPSKDTIPSSAYEGGGNHFSIFNGDPKRIQRANDVNPRSFDAAVKIAPNPLSLKAVRSVGPNPSVKITFYVHNHAKKIYTLSFPTAQRWDFRIVSATGALVYSYTEDHDFVQVVGTSMVDPNDKLSFSENVEFDDLDVPLTPGVYTIQAVLANYPEVTAQSQFTVQD